MGCNMSVNHNRLHGLDFCRAVFMILGLFLHVGLIYGVDQNWRVISNETSGFVSSISDFIHMFRMEAFYLISGFFYLLVFSKGRSGFARDRVYRALIPLLFCGFLINPLMDVYSYNRDYDWSSLEYWLQGQWLAHLWFLGNLIVYFIISLPICKWINNSKDISRTTLLLLFYVGIPIIAIIGVVFGKVTYNGTFLFISFAKLFNYYPYFIIGCFCFRNKEVFLSILNIRGFIISFCFFSFLFFLSQLNIFSGESISKTLGYLSTGSLMISMIALTYYLGAKDSRLIRSFSDSSYTIYILHQPLIIFFYVVLFQNVSWGSIIEYMLLICSVFITAYIFHIFCVKKSRTLKFLFNGVLTSNSK